MELKDFVQETLIQIITGIIEAQKHNIIKQNSAAIVPIGQVSEDRKRIFQEIDFDVAVTTQSDAEAKGGIGIFVGGIGLGTQGKVNEKDIALNRVKFKVPVQYPAQKMEQT